MVQRYTDGATNRALADDDPAQDTIALLQDEIARLEAELAARDAANVVQEQSAWVDTTPTPSGSGDEALAQRVKELSAELATRDETIELLLDQMRLIEEASLAQRSEWEQLYQWVDEVERRVDSQGTHDESLQAEVRAERARSDSLKQAAEASRRELEAQKKGLERELDHLRGQLSLGPDRGGVDVALAEENRRLRASCASLERAAAAAEDVAKLKDSFATTKAGLAHAKAELERLEDDRNRERKEYEAQLATLRSQIARESVQRGPEPAAADPSAAARPPALEADERIRAFRQHLQELHKNEEAERAARRGVATRLSRLWRRTGP
jgi:uncharacterized small protein (DUF1192 family)